MVKVGLMEIQNIEDYVVEFNPANHTYKVDGKPVISVTQLVDSVLPKRYKKVDPEILRRAAERGNELHDMIEQFEVNGVVSSSIELRSYMNLKRQHSFEALENEKMVVISHFGVPIAAGRFDMVVRSPLIKGIGIADVKRTLHIAEEHLKLQLNLYKLGYEQTYKKPVHYLKCIRVRNRFNEYLDVPVDKEFTRLKIEEYLEKNPIDFT